jgi:molybdopterin molybdotransferase
MGRILAQTVTADRDYPPFRRAMMDGYAVQSPDYAPGTLFSVRGTRLAGDPDTSRTKVTRRTALKIMTGAAVPVPFDAVIRREDATAADDGVTFCAEHVAAGLNIAPKGEDLRRSEKLATYGRRIDGAMASLLASLGVSKPLVSALPQVGIITTGSEVIPHTMAPKTSQIRNGNLAALSAQLHSCGISAAITIHVGDDPKKFARAVDKCENCDVLLVTGGVSAGDVDYVPEILAQMRFREIFHGVRMRPGKPLWFGAQRKRVVFGIPGNPFSCQVVFRVFVEPFLRASMGIAESDVLHLPIEASRNKKTDFTQFFPARIVSQGQASGVSELAEIPFRSSGDVRAAIFSDGIAEHPAESAGLKAGHPVAFYPWRSFI